MTRARITARPAEVAGPTKRRAKMTRDRTHAATGRGIAPQRLDTRGAGSPSAFAAFIESASHELLASTWWFDPTPDQAEGPVVVRVSGHRQGAGTKTRTRDHFVHDERIDHVLLDAGPVSVTARIRDINPGAWLVSARLLGTDQRDRGRHDPSGRSTAALPLHAGSWSWRSWALRDSEPHLVTTCVAPLARIPAIIPGVWAALVTLGVIAALAIQQAILVRLGLQFPQALLISLVAIAAGVVGAKIRFMAVHRSEGRFEGWSIQGFLAAIAIAAPVMLASASVPIGPCVDSSAPGLFVGLAIGRIGCFFAGCCAGRPTRAAWGMWSSDQRVGMRRIPTQLLESALALGIALLALVAVLGYRPLIGGIFVAALALYTLARQGILRLRAERPESTRGGALIALTSAVVLIGDVILLALQG